MEILLGYKLAHGLGAYIGSEVKVFTPEQAVSPLGLKRSGEWLTVSGIAQAQMPEYDMYYAWVDMETAQSLTGDGGAVAVHCKLSDPAPAAVDAVAARVETELGLDATTWHEDQAAFLGALKQEKFAMFVILVFIILVAAFNIASTLIMVVLEKRRDIGILRTLGVSGPSVLLVFMIEGILIGLSGTLFGVAAGTLLASYLNPVAAFIAGLAGVSLFDSQIYYFDRIPVALIPFDVFWITVSAVVLTFAATLYPAWSATRVDPIEALRYE